MEKKVKEEIFEQDKKNWGKNKTTVRSAYKALKEKIFIEWENQTEKKNQSYIINNLTSILTSLEKWKDDFNRLPFFKNTHIRNFFQEKDILIWVQKRVGREMESQQVSTGKKYCLICIIMKIII
jgi:hypothetical protein